MGGPGSGRKPKTDQDVLEPGEVIGESSGTVVGEPPSPQKKDNKKSKSSKVNAQADYRQKIYMLFQAAARLGRKECKYQENDFTAEAAALQRIAEKYPAVAYWFNLFDPLFMFLSLITKFSKMPGKATGKENEENKTARAAVGNVYNMQR